MRSTKGESKPAHTDHGPCEAGSLLAEKHPLIWKLVFAVSLWSLASFVAADIGYVYDEAGKLRQATNPGGDSVQYTYDAAGNITGIAQVSAATLSVVEFTPDAGVVGSTLNIFGTGFSTTPSSNTVTVNGTTATVSVSTPTKLVVTVPSGASSGAVSVQVGAATAQSTQPFNVLAGSQAPSITSFTPSIDVVGGTVTVAGSNFATTLANDRLSFHRSLAQATTATVSQIQAKVPVHATSGRLRILTPEGAATSSADFFVVPEGYVASDVGFTGRTAIGATTSINPGTGKIGMLLFDGTAGQELAIGVPTFTVTPSGAPARISVKTPNGEDLLPQQSFYSTTGFSLPKLMDSGTYVILATPYSASYALNLGVSVSQDVAGSITAGGSAVTAATGFAGQRILLGFSGTAGQRVSLRTSGVSFTGGNSMGVAITNADGSTLAENIYVNSAGQFIDPVVLPTTGTYRVVADPAYAAVTTATFTLYLPVDSSGSITPGGSAVTASTSVPGQAVNLAFTGSISQRISVGITNAAMTGAWSNNWADVFLVSPSGSVLGTITNIATNGFLDPVSLTSNGTHTVRFYPKNGSTGTATITVYDVPADVAGSIVPGGSSVTTAVSVAGQNSNLSFSGVGGQRVSLAITGVSLTGLTPSYLNNATYRIRKSDGTTVASLNSGTSPLFIDTTTLAATDTYVVNFDPSAQTIGTATFTLYDVPADPTSSVTIGGGTTTLALTVPGQNAYVTFAGTNGQQATVRIKDSTVNGSMTVTLRNPSGGTVTFATSSSANFNLSTVTLPATGTYTIFVNPAGSATGSLSVEVTSP